jgi:chlorobactene glucosyltransferase
VLVLCAGAAWAGLVLWLLARVLRQFKAHRPLPAVLPALDGAAASVAVIVPVRNEIGNIDGCLAGLRHQSGLAGGPAIIVVDDESQDGTADAVARAAAIDPRIRLIPAGPLPRGWMGKPHACWRGALAAEAEWLCFIDADVRAAPGLVATALAAAETRGIDLLSLAPFQVLGSFWERLIVPAALLLIACVLDQRAAERPGANDVPVNGQILLVRRSVYLASGGHAAVRNEVSEDKALAARIRDCGWRYRFHDAGGLAATRMYTGFKSLWSGFVKNAVEIVGGCGDTVAAATAGMIVAWSAVLIPLSAARALIGSASVAEIVGFGFCLAGSLIISGVQTGTVRHLRVPIAFALLFPLAYSAVAALAWHSAIVRRAGRVSWKGRIYEIQRHVGPRPS